MQLATSIGVDPHADLQKEVGIFVGVTVMLTGLTVAGAFYWQRRDELLRISRRQNAV